MTTLRTVRSQPSAGFCAREVVGASFAFLVLGADSVSFFLFLDIWFPSPGAELCTAYDSSQSQPVWTIALSSPEPSWYQHSLPPSQHWWPSSAQGRRRKSTSGLSRASALGNYLPSVTFYVFSQPRSSLVLLLLRTQRANHCRPTMHSLHVFSLFSFVGEIHTTTGANQGRRLTYLQQRRSGLSEKRKCLL